MECEAMINSSTLLSGLLRACGTICILLILFLVSFDSWCFMSGLRVANDIPTLSLDDYKAGWEGRRFLVNILFPMLEQHLNKHSATVYPSMHHKCRIDKVNLYYKRMRRVNFTGFQRKTKGRLYVS